MLVDLSTFAGLTVLYFLYDWRVRRRPAAPDPGRRVRHGHLTTRRPALATVIPFPSSRSHRELHGRQRQRA
jgi:hypothetical protein